MVVVRIILGKRDLDQNVITLKDMQKGKESAVKRDDLIVELQKLLV